MFKKFSTVFMAVLFVALTFATLGHAKAETFSDLTVTGDAHFQYPIYADGGQLEFGGGDLRIVDFNQGGSRIFNQGDLHVVTDDNLYFDFSNVSGLSMTEFASRMTVNDNLYAQFPIYAQGNEIVFNGSGVAQKSADGTPRIYRNSDTLRLMAPNMNLDVTGTTTIENDLTVGGNLQVTGTQTYTGNTTYSGTLTINDTSSSAFWNKGESTLAGDVWAEDYVYFQDGSGGNAMRWDYGVTTNDYMTVGYYDATAGTTTEVLTIDNSGDLVGAADISITGTTGANMVATAGDNDITATAGSVVVTGGEAAVDAIDINASDAAGGIDIDAGTGGIDLLTTGAFSIDGTGASNVTADSGNLTLASTTSGDVDISAAAELDLDGGSSVVMNSVTSMTLTGGSTIALNATNDLDITSAVDVDLGAAEGVDITNTAATVDAFTVNQTTTDAAGLDAAVINLTAANGTDRTARGVVIDVTSQGTAATDVTYGLYLDLAATAGADDTAIKIASTAAWDTDIELQNGEVIINDTDSMITIGNDTDADLTLEAEAGTNKDFVVDVDGTGNIWVKRFPMHMSFNSVITDSLAGHAGKVAYIPANFFGKTVVVTKLGLATFVASTGAATNGSADLSFRVYDGTDNITQSMNGVSTAVGTGTVTVATTDYVEIGYTSNAAETADLVSATIEYYYDY